jgi:tripartite ATP-independent transporter DctM subunit
MTQVALPELRRYGYSGALATGTLAAGGTLGVLIPPSVVLVIYAILAEQNVAKLFVAAFVPGVLAAAGYMVAIALYVRVCPDSAGSGPRRPWAERIAALAEVWPVAAIFLAVVGGIYAGWFTPTEGAAVGAAGTGLVAFVNGGLTRRTLVEAILATATSTAMIFFIVFGAAMYNSFLALSQLPAEAAAYIAGQGFPPLAVLIGILIFYLVLGCFMDSLSMILLTVPIFFPLVSGLDFGLGAEEFAIWFGILVLVVVEVGLITPPVGMNLFVINSMAKDIPMLATYRGVTPFVVSDIARTIILVAFPALSLFMVRWLY